MSEAGSRRLDPGALPGLLSFGVPLAVYWRTACPTVYFGDGGELTTTAHFLGVAHPTGYPVYCLLGHLFQTLIPWGSPAWRMNLLSAVAAAVASFVIYRIARRLSADPATSLGAACIGAFSSVFWSQAVITEVYTLHAVFFLGALGAWLAYAENGRRRDACVASLAFGLGLAHHLSIAVLVAAAACLALSTQRGKLLSWRLWLPCLLLTLGSLGFYLYLPLRSATEPVASWAPIDSFEQLMFHIRGGLYEGNLLRGGGYGLAANLLDYGLSLPQRITLPVCGFAVLGWLRLWRLDRFAALYLSVALLATTLFAAAYHVVDREAYFIPTDLLLAVFAAVGFGLVAKPRWLAPALALSVACFVAVVHFPENDRSQNRMAHGVATNILESLAPDAILFAERDHYVPMLAYVHLVEGVRPDVTLYSRTQNLLPYLEGSPRLSRPAYYSHQRGDQPFLLVPYGLLYQAVTPAQPQPEPRDLWSTYDLEGVAVGPPYSDGPSRTAAALYWVRKASYQAFSDDRRAALESAGQASEIGDGITAVHLMVASWLLGWRELDAAEREFMRAVRDPGGAGDAWFGIGMIRARQGHARRAAEALREALRLGTLNDQRARITLAAALYESGARDEAREVAEAVLALQPDEPTTRALLQRMGTR
jgi:tetratricopeptide (TPR) repeat protein